MYFSLSGVVFSFRGFVVARVFPLFGTLGVFPLFSLARFGHFVVQVTIRPIGALFH